MTTEEQVKRARLDEIEKSVRDLLAHLEATKKQALRLALISADREVLGTMTVLDKLIEQWAPRCAEIPF